VKGSSRPCDALVSLTADSGPVLPVGPVLPFGDVARLARVPARPRWRCRLRSPPVPARLPGCRFRRRPAALAGRAGHRVRRCSAPRPRPRPVPPPGRCRWPAAELVGPGLPEPPQVGRPREGRRARQGLALRESASCACCCCSHPRWEFTFDRNRGHAGGNADQPVQAVCATALPRRAGARRSERRHRNGNRRSVGPDVRPLLLSTSS
jgi:hypothetical protein